MSTRAVYTSHLGLSLLLLLRGACVGVGVDGYVGVVVRGVVEGALRDCHLVVVGVNIDSGIVPVILRSLDASSLTLPRVLVNLKEQGWVEEEVVGVGLEYEDLRRRDARFGCWAMLIGVTQGTDLLPISQFLERTQMYRWPNVHLVYVGPTYLANPSLTHPALRNAAHLTYLAYNVTTAAVSAAAATSAVSASSAATSASAEGPVQVEVIWRCLYCNEGRSSLTPLYTWFPPRHPATPTPLYTWFPPRHPATPTPLYTWFPPRHPATPTPHTLFPDQFRNLGGVRLRVVTMDWFPFIKFRRSSNQGGALVTPLDSLDYRMLQTIAKHLNFTYEMRTPWDNQWGTSTPSGNWTGIVGTLQHQTADFSMMLSWLYNRLPVVDYSRIYSSEPLVMVTSKPLPLPQALALVRPFSGNVWMLTLACTVVAWAVLWWVQEGWAWASGGRGLGAGRAALLTWGILLEDPPYKLPKNITAQMVIGWWWVCCMLLAITYRSSLIAHLTVPGKSPSLESLEALLEAHRREGWTWGFEPTYGSGWEWLKISESPTVKQIFNSIMVLNLEDQLSRVMAGHHAFITWKYYIRAIIGARYTDTRGYTPIHTAREEYFNYGGYGWGYRKGAPFRSRFDSLKGRLTESGLIALWLEQLLEAAGREARITRRRQVEGRGGEEGTPQYSTMDAGSRIVLGLGHLQGLFYLLSIGYGLALLAFIAELLARPRHTHAP